MPSSKPGSRLIKAAGGVAWRPGLDDEPEVLLVHRKKYDDWSLPKGKSEPGELLPVTAVREVLEEGGARLALGRRLVSVRYHVGGRPKRVHYWAARVVSLDSRAVPNSEVDEVTWLPAASAVEKVSYVHDHGVLADFAARPAATVPLILLRHATAVAKGSWNRSDLARPLNGAGRAEAKTLTDLLACFAPHPRVISSPAVRCMDTILPFAELAGADVRKAAALYVHGPEARAGAAAPAIAALVRKAIASGEPTVICAHRENLPTLQEAALAALAGHPAAEIPATDLPGTSAGGVRRGLLAEIRAEWDDDLPPGGCWVLNVTPLPAAAGPAPALPVTRPPAPQPHRPAPGRRWWRGVRPRSTGARSANSRAVSGGPGVRGVPGGAAHHGTATDPIGVLISADRYDTSEP
jgi:8-oxo-dGTP pyrophosphatase MutT (NUDIX family)/phosphohistidine phosphatase SixA